MFSPHLSRHLCLLKKKKKVFKDRCFFLIFFLINKLYLSPKVTLRHKLGQSHEINLQKLEMHLKLTHLYLGTGDAEEKKRFKQSLEGLSTVQIQLQSHRHPFWCSLKLAMSSSKQMSLSGKIKQTNKTNHQILYYLVVGSELQTVLCLLGCCRSGLMWH